MKTRRFGSIWELRSSLVGSTPMLSSTSRVHRFATPKVGANTALNDQGDNISSAKLGVDACVAALTATRSPGIQAAWACRATGLKKETRFSLTTRAQPRMNSRRQRSGVVSKSTTCTQLDMVPGTGLEPARLAAVAPKATASTNSAIPARSQLSSSSARRIRSENSMIATDRFRSYAAKPIVARTPRREPTRHRKSRSSAECLRFTRRFTLRPAPGACRL
jgi:hypothetical protein